MNHHEMNREQMNRIAKVADAVLWEGYMLYPYRPSNIKNRQRWTFGGLYPSEYGRKTGEPSELRAEVLVQSSIGPKLAKPRLTIVVRFLHLLSQDADGRSFQRAVERQVILSGLPLESRHLRTFRFSSVDQQDNEISVRQERIDGSIQVVSEQIDAELHKLTLIVANTTPFRGPLDMSRDHASLQALVSTHAIFHASHAGFISQIDPPVQLREATDECVNRGVWPVLAGEPGSAEWMLVPPMILPDYPQIAAESPGDLFDGTEIDEILTLRVLTMTDDEKEEVRQADPRLADLLDRTHSLTPEEMLRLHGALRKPQLQSAAAD